jgi:hypothetical protein
MAKIVEDFICPSCNQRWQTYAEALKCRNSHPPIKQAWAEGIGGKRCLVSYFGEEKALFEADLPDYIEKRKKRLKKLFEEDPEKCKRLGYYNADLY